MNDASVSPAISEVLQILKIFEVNAEYWHSGGGIFGIMVWLPDGKSLFWGAVDGVWAYDYMEADNDYISSGVTDFPEHGFAPSSLAQAIVDSVKALS